MVFPARLSRPRRWPCGRLARLLVTVLSAVLLGGVLLAPSLRAAADDGARAEFLRGYKFFEAAEKSDAAHDYAGALEGYRQAQQVYQGIAAQWPKWNEDLITYRIKYCNEKSGALDKLVQAQRRAQPTPEGVAVNAKLEADLVLAKATLGENQLEIARLTQALEKARSEAAGNADAVELNKKLVWQDREKSQTIDALNAKLTELSRSLAMAKDDDTLNKAHLELQAAREQLATTVQQAKDDRARLEASATDLGAQLKRVSLERAEAQLKLDALGPGAQAVEARRAQAQAAADAAQQRIAELTTQVTDGKATAAQLQQQVAELTGTLAKVQRDDQHDTLADTLKAQQETVQTREDLQRQVAATEKLKAELARALEDLGVVQQANARLRDQLQAGERELDRLAHTGATSTEDLQVARAQAEKVARDLQEMQGKYDALVAMNRTLNANSEELTAKYKAQLQVNELLLNRLKDAAIAPPDETIAGSPAVAVTPAPVTPEAVAPPAAVLTKPLPAATGDAAEAARLRQRLDDLQQRQRAEVALLNRQITTLIEQLDQERAKSAERAGSKVAATTPGGTTPPSERVQALLRRAVAAEKQGQTETAIFQYQQALELDPAQPVALVRLGNLALDGGRPKDAEKYLLRAFYVNPDDKDVLLPLGSIYVRQEKADLAIAMLARAVALYPDQAPMHRFLGVACSSLGWLEAGEVQLKRAFALDAKDPETAFDLAVLYATKEPARLPLARQWYATAKELGAASDPGLEKLFGAATP